MHYPEKSKGGKNKRSSSDNDEDEDVNLQNSDEDEEEAGGESPLLEIIRQNVPKLEEYLASAKPRNEIGGSYIGTNFLPLGSLRLRLVELVYLLLKLNKTPVYEMIATSNILHNILELLINYPWNNFLQLKVVSIFEEILENCGTPANREALLKKSGIVETLIRFGKEPSYSHESDRQIRHGYMAAVIKLANQLNKHQQDKEDVKAYLNSTNGEWTKFMETEVKRSNDDNNRSLGG